ncbi:MAG TPA: VOC family protein [Longimicrobium sp.]|nr:VOC family protein [Longimicrobium sp.]
MHPARIHFPGPHLGLCVSDVARSRTFFVEQLGFLPDSVIDLPGIAAHKLLRLPDCQALHAEYLWREGFCLELLSYEGTGRTPHPRAPANALGLAALTLETRDLPEVLRRLQASGAEVLTDRVLPGGGAPPRAVSVRDPDGELFQLVSTGAGALGLKEPRWWPSMPHLVLTVSNLERSVRFYRDVLGLLVEGEHAVEGTSAVGLLDLPEASFRQAALWKAGLCLLLREYRTPSALPKRGGGMNQLGFTHLSFNVHDLPGTLDAARRFGVEMMDDTALVMDPARPPVAVFLRDPDGQLIELLPL